MNERLHLLVSGRVQGVAFRAHTRAQAEALGLSGWVRNLPDGRVEAIAEGPRPALEALATWARSGPPAANVTNLEARYAEARGEPPGFTIMRW